MCILNGDTMDMFMMSDFNKNPDKESVQSEFEATRDFIKLMKKIFKHVIFKEGNHEERWTRFLQKNPQVFNLPEIQLRNLLGLEESEYIGDKRPIKCGKLNIIHGHEIGQGIYSPVNFARTLANKLREPTIAGHCHQTSEQPLKKPLSGDFASCWSQGHLGEENPLYRPVNEWNHGFSFIEVDEDGTFKLQNKRIHKGKVL